jgi:hypothetical protein
VPQAEEQAEIVPGSSAIPVQEIATAPTAPDSPDTEEHSEDEQLSFDLRSL